MAVGIGVCLLFWLFFLLYLLAPGVFRGRSPPVSCLEPVPQSEQPAGLLCNRIALLRREHGWEDVGGEGREVVESIQLLSPR